MEPALVVRRMDFPFPGSKAAAVDEGETSDEGLPRHWFGGDAFLTHFVNGLHYVFPGGERFFIRSVRAYREQLDEVLTERVKGFHGQEAEHQREHRRAFEAIEASGYEIQSFLDWYHHWAYDVLEPRFPRSVRLATTVALEHFTALFGEVALGTDLLDSAEPVMRDLLLWHAAEEIEHKSVAFDVFQKVDGRYPVRVAGFVIAVATLGVFWTAGVRHMLRQEPPGEGEGEAKERRRRGHPMARFLRKHGPRLLTRGLDFLRPGFHPDQHRNHHLAVEHFERIGRTDH